MPPVETPIDLLFRVKLKYEKMEEKMWTESNEGTQVHDTFQVVSFYANLNEAAEENTHRYSLR